MIDIQKQLQAILMTAGSEKLQSETRWKFTLANGKSKVIPFYWQDKDTDGEVNADFTLSNYPANRIDWKSRCAGGYYNMLIQNTEVNGALLGLTWLGLNKQNFDTFDTALDVLTNVNMAKTTVYDGIIQDTLKNDDISRQFVPHIKYQALPVKGTHFEEGVLPTGKKTNPITTPFIKALMVSNLTPVTSSVTFQIVQNYYEYSPGVSIPTRSVVNVSDEA